MKNSIIMSIECSQKVITNNWKLHIIFYLASGPKRFGELLYHNPGITQRTLSNNLRQLLDDGMLIKKVYPEVPPRTEYSLTPIGEEFIPVLESLVNWGFKYSERNNTSTSSPFSVDNLDS